MPYQVNRAIVKLRDQPRDDSMNAAGSVVMTDLLEKMAEATVPGWWHMRVITTGSVAREGFIRQELLVEAADALPLELIDLKAFFDQLTLSARAFGTNNQYLYALAVVESGVRNVASKSSSAIGPFQFMPATWADLVDRHGASTGVSANDIREPGAQAILAAASTADAQRKLAGLLGRVPTGAELYLAHFFGLAAATAVLRAHAAQPVDRALRAFYRGTAKGEAFVERILHANASQLMPGGRISTTAELLQTVMRRFEKGAEEAALRAAEFGPPPEKLPGDPGEEPPWLAAARGQLAQGVVEDKATGASNPEIEKYFRATIFGPARDDTPWCAAFVSWCMANCGDPRVAAGNLRSARAADWINWGFAVGRPAIGAVVVTHPLVTGSSGHVGFLTGVKGGDVTLLAGNQRDQADREAVCERLFTISAVRDFRWLDWKDPVIPAGGGQA